MTQFLSCDWGSSFLRLRLVDNLQVLAEATCNKGISIVHGLWKERDNTNEDARISFYLGFIAEQLSALEQSFGQLLNGLPIIISGMASSTIGMLELPYKTIPFATNGTNAITKQLNSIPGFNHPVLLISGVKTDSDVMRGEETQLVGCVSETGDSPTDQLFIFPGTHSKHIVVKSGQVTAITTYMTGEFFELLSEKSMLHGSIEKAGEDKFTEYIDAFQKGIKDAVSKNLLHAAFTIRINSLFNITTGTENFHYLSGLLIGSELKEIAYSNFNDIIICGGSSVGTYYEQACRLMNIKNFRVIPKELAERAVIIGQSKIFNHSNTI